MNNGKRFLLRFKEKGGTFYLSWDASPITPRWVEKENA
jgi:hypothetical protein